MDLPPQNKSLIQPKTMAELFSSFGNLMPKDALSITKQPRKTLQLTRTAEKVAKPLTMAEMKAELGAILKFKSPSSFAQPLSTSKKKVWNSSVKLENKKISHVSGGRLKHNSVRKTLNFQPNRVQTNLNLRKTMAQATPKFPKLELKAKKAVHMEAPNNNIRISGICDITQTPIVAPKNTKIILTKENIPKAVNSKQKMLKKSTTTPKSVSFKKLVNPNEITDSPISNDSWKSSCDASFIQKEKEIHDVQEKVLVLSEQSIENIAEISPPASTPFKEYRNVKENLNNTSYMDNSTSLNDDTIMIFDKTSVKKEDNIREETVIVSLCDLLSKTSVTTSKKKRSQLENLVKLEKLTEDNIKMIENGIKVLMDIKDSHVQSLQNVRRLICEKKNDMAVQIDKDKTLVDSSDIVLGHHIKQENAIYTRSLSVIKSPAYKIPKKNLGLRKKVIFKSMPDLPSEFESENKNNNRALDMYLKMKENMNFLSTPVSKNRQLTSPDTPAVTSHNLQKQLDKLFNGV